MAVITAYQPLDMSSTLVGGGNGYFYDDTHIQVVDSSDWVDYYGYGFAIDESDNLTGGTLQQINAANWSGLQFVITGLNHDFLTYNNYLLNNDLQGALAYLFSGDDIFSGSNGNDYGIGYAGNDTISGGLGHDTLDGSSGIDSLLGGGGNDSYLFDGIDILVEDVNAGFDTIIAGFSYVLPANFESLVLTGVSALNGTGNALANLITGTVAHNRLEGADGADSLSGGGGDDTLDGGSGADSLIGGEGHDKLDGGSGSDSLSGSDGNDTLDGGSEADHLMGGAGSDLYLVDGGDVVVDVADDLSVDVVWASGNFTLPDFVENLVITGSGDYYGYGNGLDNLIIGNAGRNTLSGGGGSNDTLDGGAGADVMWGGGGIQLCIVDDPGDKVYGYHTGGYEIVRSSVSYTLEIYTERLELVGSALNGSGNDRANVLIGNDADNVLNGNGGLDTLVGGAGNDTYVVDALQWPHILQFSGEPGEYVSDGKSHLYTGTTGLFSVPTVQDQTGDGLVDYIHFNYDDGQHWWNLNFGSADLGRNLAPGEYVATSSGNPDLFLFGDGRSEGYSDRAFTIGSIEIDYSGVAPVILKFSADFSFGEGGPTLLSGSLLYDLTSGWEIETVNELANEGRDTLRSSVSAALPDHVELLVLTGSGNSEAFGNSGDNIVSGNAGNNLLDGASGVDIIAGGAGNDTYVIDNGGDQVMELANSGNDKIQSSVSYSLMQAWHVENLTLTDANAINGFGNWMDNVITGNAASNLLEGDRGNDTISGGGGSDTLIGGLGDDVLVWDALDAKVDGGDGFDRLLVDGSGVTLDLTAIANSVITSIEYIDITGSGNNTLTLALADVLALTPNTLRIFGDAGDVVNGGSGWTPGGTVSLSEGVFNVYTQSTAVLLVDSDVTRVFG